MINNSKKKHWKIRAQRIELCLFLSIWLYIYAQKKISLGEKFLIKVVFMSERLNMYVSKQTHCSRKIDAYRLIDPKNKKIKYCPVYTCLSPTQCPAHEYIYPYIIFFFFPMWDLRIFTTLKLLSSGHIEVNFLLTR